RCWQRAQASVPVIPGTWVGTSPACCPIPWVIRQSPPPVTVSADAGTGALTPGTSLRFLSDTVSCADTVSSDGVGAGTAEFSPTAVAPVFCGPAAGGP